MEEMAGGAGNDVMRKAFERLAGAKTRSRIAFADGTTLSAQANEFTYCWPRDNTGPWTCVEVGMPSCSIAELMPFAEEPSDPTGTVYARVPVVLLAWVAASKGGRVDRQEAWMERRLGGDVIVPEAKEADVEQARAIEWADFEANALEWCQAAILRSPDEERRARFAIVAAEGCRIEWPDILSCFATAMWSSERDNIAEWRSKICQRVELEIAVAKPRDESARARRSI